jgi:hypothetical protein
MATSSVLSEIRHAVSGFLKDGRKMFPFTEHLPSDAITALERYKKKPGRTPLSFACVVGSQIGFSKADAENLKVLAAGERAK